MPPCRPRGAVTAPDPSSVPELAQGRSAFERREWRAAFELLSAVEEEHGLGPADLWRLALAGYLVGRDDAYRGALERAHRLHLEAGEAASAARSAVWLGLHLAEAGEMARATGWFGRASRVLEGETGDCVERGYLRIPEGLRQLSSGELEAAARTAAEAAECAQRFGDRDLLALAVHMQGVALLRAARVGEGLALLDEAMVAVATDELSPQVTGIIYCSVIGACRRVYALDRANEWTAALAEWCERQPDMVAFRGECRVYRAELLQLGGEWSDALAEARRVGAGDAVSPAIAGAARYQEGEVYRLRGELEAAEAAYREAGRAGREPQPGLALLRLAQGDLEAATAAVRRALDEAPDPLRRARLLPVLVEILLEGDDVEAAARGCAELEEIASEYGTRVLGILVAHARGAVALARDSASTALAPLRQAVEGWSALGAPYEAARARVLLGRACRSLGDDDSATLELEAARTAFDRLGAEPEVDRVDSLLRRGGRGVRSRHGLTPREREVLALVATGKTNRAIAEELFISEKTVARHLSNIYMKLDLSSRAAATAFAYEHDLTDPSA